MRISDWSSDVCSSDLIGPPGHASHEVVGEGGAPAERRIGHASKCAMHADHVRSHELERLRGVAGICVELSESAVDIEAVRSEEHTSELPSLMRISYAVFCLKKKIHISSLYNFPTINHTHYLH